METRKRSVAKAIVWNLIGLAMMAAIGLAVTGSALEGGAIALSNTALGFAAYLAYERIWARIGWGRDV